MTTHSTTLLAIISSVTLAHSTVIIETEWNQGSIAWGNDTMSFTFTASSAGTYNIFFNPAPWPGIYGTYQTLQVLDDTDAPTFTLPLLTNRRR